MKKTVKQAIGFVVISGIGWLIDFSIYCLITGLCSLPVGIANIISSTPAITFVFFTSTKRTFQNKPGSLKLGYKYMIYFGYQLILLLCISSFAQFLYISIMASGFIHYALFIKYLKVLIKIAITPITMTINFIVMKLLIEKI